jgi:hypothetical protein
MPAGLTMTVYRYAVKGDLPAEAAAELRRAHRLRNKLTEIELGYQEQVAAAWAAHPQIAAALECLEQSAAAVSDLTGRAKARRAADRSAKPDPEVTAALKDARAARSAGKLEVRRLKDQYYASGVRPALLAARDARHAAVKGTYPQSVGEGLYWATVNDVTDHHSVSVQQVAAKRKAGLPAQVRFRRWRGEGTLAVQLQRQAGDPARDPEMIASAGGKWRNVAALGPHAGPDDFAALPRGERRAAARRGVLRFRIGSGAAAATVTVPVVIHRMLPAGADITGMRITRRVLAGKPEVTVSVSARVPAPLPRTEGSLAAVHAGWRALPDGALRVAVVAGAGTPPAGLAAPGRDQVARDHGGWAELVIPAGWRSIQARDEKLRGRRDGNLNVLRAWLLAWLAGQPEWCRRAADPDGTLASWRSPARFARLARSVAADGVPPADPGWAEAYRQLAAWYRQDLHLREWECCERDQLTRMRDEAWRRAAAWITGGAALVVMDEWQVAPLARRPDVTGEDDPQARAARANRFLAAPGALLSAIRGAAGRRGVTVTEPGAEGAAAHYACGTPLDAAQRMAQVMVWCSRCGVMVDQDWNALQVLLAAARGQSAASGGVVP